MRLHPIRNLEAIKASLKRFGQQRPIVVDKNHIVRAGNATLQAARELGWERLDIIVSDLAPAELTAFAIADNRTAELAEWDLELLIEQLDGAELDGLGFTESEIDELIFSLELESEIKEALDTNSPSPGMGKDSVIKVALRMSEVTIFEEALMLTGVRNRGEALAMVCQSFVDNEGR